MIQYLRKMVDRFLQKVADQNQKQFGTQRMDCCKMNKEPEKAKRPGTDSSKTK